LAHVSQWYFEWKRSFPDQLAKNPHIIQQFNIALEMMQSSTTGVVKAPPAPQYVPLPKIQFYDDTRETTRQEPQRNDKDLKRKHTASAGPVESSSHPEPTTFKELVEDLAAKNDVLFMPTKRSYESKTVHTFGKVSLVIDKNVLLVWRSGKWVPVGLDELVKLGK